MYVCMYENGREEKPNNEDIKINEINIQRGFARLFTHLSILREIFWLSRSSNGPMKQRIESISVIFWFDIFGPLMCMCVARSIFEDERIFPALDCVKQHYLQQHTDRPMFSSFVLRFATNFNALHWNPFESLSFQSHEYVRECTRIRFMWNVFEFRHAIKNVYPRKAAKILWMEYRLSTLWSPTCLDFNC